MKILLLVLMALCLSGCLGARYHYAEYDPSTGNVVREFQTNSRRDLESLQAQYGDFNISVGKATTPASPFEQVFAEMLPSILQRAVMYPATPVPPE